MLDREGKRRRTESSTSISIGIGMPGGPTDSSARKGSSEGIAGRSLTIDARGSSEEGASPVHPVFVAGPGRVKDRLH
jgi:hypothetical protein